jgi:hypothetical protein
MHPLRQGFADGGPCLKTGTAKSKGVQQLRLTLPGPDDGLMIGQ